MQHRYVAGTRWAFADRVTRALAADS